MEYHKFYKMKKLFFFFICINQLYSQELIKSVKFSNFPTGLSIDSTSDGGVLVVGGTNGYWTFNGCTTGNSNVWAAKYDINKTLVWSICLGTTFIDTPSVIKQLPDGNILIAYVTNYQPSYIVYPYAQITKLSPSGTIIWTKSYFSNQLDLSSVNDIIVYPNGDFIIAGKKGNFWISKLDSSGNVLWETFGGGNGAIVSIYPTADGGFVSIGKDYHSPNNPPTQCSNAKGISGDDVFIKKINANGVLEWENCYGGSGNDNPHQIIQTQDGGYLFLSSTLSNDYDVVGAKGGKDIWIVKLNTGGSILWSKCYGGFNDEIPGRFFSKTNGNFLICASSASTDGDLSGKNTIAYNNPNNLWFFEINPIGEIKWQYILNSLGEETVGFVEFYHGGDSQNRRSDFTFNPKTNLLNFAVHYKDPIYGLHLWLGTLTIPNCISQVVLNNNNYSNTTIESSDYIQSVNQVQVNNTVNLNASKYILLNPNFTTQNGSVFKAEIKNNCGTN